MNFALTHFTLAFKVKISSQDDDCNSSILDIDNKPFVLNKATGVFDGSKGCYLDWSLDGNNQWQGTAGTTKNFHTIARTIKNGQLTSNVHAVLDREAGTLQIWDCGINERLDQNARSQSVKIRGVDNSLPCDDPKNHSGIYNWSAAGRVISASVI